MLQKRHSNLHSERQSSAIPSINKLFPFPKDRPSNRPTHRRTHLLMEIHLKTLSPLNTEWIQKKGHLLLHVHLPSMTSLLNRARRVSFSSSSSFFSSFSFLSMGMARLDIGKRFRTANITQTVPNVSSNVPWMPRKYWKNNCKAHFFIIKHWNVQT